jgi:hypothetical protein
MGQRLMKGMAQSVGPGSRHFLGFSRRFHPFPPILWYRGGKAQEVSGDYFAPSPASATADWRIQMPLDHLQGKRTGRPRGSKSSSPLKRDLLWACRNLGNDVEPPTLGAKYWSEMARNEPDKFVKAVAELDAANRRSGEKTPPSEPQPGNPVARAGQRRKTVFLTETEIHTAISAFCKVNLPVGARLVGCVMTQERGGFLFTVYSKSFDQLAEGVPIPELLRADKSSAPPRDER